MKLQGHMKRQKLLYFFLESSACIRMKCIVVAVACMWMQLFSHLIRIKSRGFPTRMVYLKHDI